MRSNVAISLLLSVFLTSIVAAEGLVKDELRSLQGSWDLSRGEVGPEIFDVEKVEKTDRTRISWKNEGDRLTIFAGSNRVDTVHLEIVPNVTPKQLDLLPIEKNDKADHASPDVIKIHTRTKYLYELDGDTLKIAQTFGFYPSTPERERQLAIQYANKRPRSFDTKTPQPPDGTTEVSTNVLVLTFKRTKKD